ncbi:DNA adenine methylase [Neisseria flavescens SK114]|nr:DNA adenine methylase [Neisseria flavescens SK114]
MIKSPMNYTGGKYRLLPQILPLFPRNIDTFVDVFCGGCNVGINVSAQQWLFNDNLIHLIELYKYMKNNKLIDILSYIEQRIAQLTLSQTNENAYRQLRQEYNQYKHPLDLFVLTAFSFNHQIRFNNSHQFNTPFGKDRSSFNERMKSNLIDFIYALQKENVQFSQKSFELLDYSYLKSNDLVYCDPPYLITIGTYNDGKRGFKGWGIDEEYKLLQLLDDLNKQGIRFALSNVLMHKGKENRILQDWLYQRNYTVHNLNMHYGNASYHTKNRDKSASREVLITNYSTENQ